MDFNNVSRRRLTIYGAVGGVVAGIVGMIPFINCISCFLWLAILIGAGYLFTRKFDFVNSAIDALSFAAGYAAAGLVFGLIGVVLGLGISMPGIMVPGSDSSSALAAVGTSIAISIVALLVGVVINLVVSVVLYLVGAFIKSATS